MGLLSAGVCAADSDPAPTLFSLVVPPRTSAPPDPRLPTGASTRPPAVRPATAQRPACSSLRPVCVHRSAGVSSQQALEALEALEEAYLRLVLALNVPAPLPDGGAGGSDALDLYLAPEGEFLSSLDRRRLGGFDRASAFCLGTPVHGERARRQATLCVAEASVWRMDAGTTPHLRRAYAAELWRAVGKPTADDAEATHRLQLQPESPLLTRELSDRSEGSSLFFEFLDERYAATRPGALATAMLSMAASKSPAGAPSSNNEPDLTDVLRTTLRKRPKLARFWSRLALARCVPEATTSWRATPARPAWSVHASSLPRRLLLPPLAPTGAACLELKLDRWKQGATLALEASWESPVSFSWSAAELDAKGRLLRVIHVPFLEREREVRHRIQGLVAGHRLVFSATQLGGSELAHPFDPDVAPFEAHGSTLYLVALP